MDRRRTPQVVRTLHAEGRLSREGGVARQIDADRIVEHCKEKRTQPTVSPGVAGVSRSVAAIAAATRIASESQERVRVRVRVRERGVEWTDSVSLGRPSLVQPLVG
jgi:hypothetical protein